MEDTGSIASGSGGTESGSSAPLTFQQAFSQSEASPASSSPSGSESAQPAAEQPDASTGSPQQGTEDRSPFIPRARFDEVNTKLNTLKEQYKWADGLEAQRVQRLVAFEQALQADPIATLRQELNALAQHPVYGPQLKSLAAQQLSARRAQSQPEAQEPQPDIRVALENGQEVLTYSAQQLAKREAYLRDQIRDQVLAQAKQEFGPQLETATELKALREQAVREQQATHFASGVMAEVSKWPGFSEHKAELHAALKAYPLQSDHPAEVKAALMQLYAQIVVPKLQQSSQSQLLDSLKQKAAAATSVNPNGAAPSSPKPVASFYDKSLVWK